MRRMSRATAAGPWLAYHASKTPLAIGTVLEPRRMHLMDSDIEDALDAGRPAERRARADSVFATPHPRHIENLTAHLDYVYTVEVVDGTTVDHAYANRIWQMFAENENAMTDAVRQRIAILARLYWKSPRANFPGKTGILCPYAPEILCREARVVAVAPSLAA